MDSTETVQQGHVSIAGLEKAAVLHALWHGSRAQGMSFMGLPTGDVTVEMCEEAVSPDADNSNAHAHQSRPLHFDYWHGRVLKVDISGDSFDPWGYDRDNGQGAAERVIEALR